MKQLTCEMCGSTDLLKQDGVFVCQTCGCKYSVEEAKKMMVEGTVDVSGSTVKLDTSNELSNLYQIARRAKAENNSESAEKYYDMILVQDPNSWEAAFYIVYFRATNCVIAQIESAAISMSNCLNSVLKLIKGHVNGWEEQNKAIQEVMARCTLLSGTLFACAKNCYYGLGADLMTTQRYRQEAVDRMCAASNIMLTLGGKIDEHFNDHVEAHTYATLAWKNGIERHCDSLMGILTRVVEEDESNKLLIERYTSKINKYEETYTEPPVEEVSGGCYVATAVYGSYDCPQVWTLRRFRDYTLAETWYGRAFIHAYYAISPTLVKWFGHTKWFKKMWQGKLDRLVAKLQYKGVASTPYRDRKW